MSESGSVTQSATFSECTGNPNSQLAGSAAYAKWANSPPDIAWDGGNFWVCTQSGSATTAVWVMMTTTNLKTPVNAFGSVTSGTVTLNRALGRVQSLTVGGNLTIALSGWIDGAYSDIILELTNGAAHTVTWPTGVIWIAPVTGANDSTFAATSVTLQSSGVDWVEFWTPDGGTTVFAKVLR